MQNTRANGGFIPVISSLAGSSLTYANWEKTGVRSISIHLQHLLMKPGLALLNRLENIRSYYKWPHEIILNALLPQSSEEGVYKIRSRYDGSLIQMDRQSLFLLIARLKPDKVLLPTESLAYVSEYPTLLEGVQIVIPHTPDTEKPFFDYVQQVKNSSQPFYGIGDFSLEEMRKLSSLSCFFETDTPLRDGMIGTVYTHQGLLSLLDDHLKNTHQVIDKDCQCETCSQNFTQAYFYHLLEQTPLLAQRFLIQHNVFYCRNHLRPFTSA